MNNEYPEDYQPDDQSDETLQSNPDGTLQEGPDGTLQTQPDDSSESQYPEWQQLEARLCRSIRVPHVH